MNLYTNLAKTIEQNQREEAQQCRERYEFQRITSGKAAKIMRKLGFKDAVAEQNFSGRQDVHATFLGHDILLGVCSEGSVVFLPPVAPLGPLGRDWIRFKQDLSDLPTIIQMSLAAAIGHGLKPKGN